MFSLSETLLGVQLDEVRREPILPGSLQAVTFSEAVIDSRLVTPNSLFVALTGERVDGHDFLADVVSRGARGALVRRERLERITLDRPQLVVETSGPIGPIADPQAFLLIPVDDPLAALQRLAAYHRGLFTPTVVGITGSVGKTSTKEVTAAVLQRRYRTLKNIRSYNSEATLPITLLQLEASHEVAVLEMGCYGPGDITFLAGIARPDIGIVTNVGYSHMGRMGSFDAVAQAKSELVQALPANGHAILNYDDYRVRAMADLTAARPFFYGLDPAADLWADAITSHGLEGITFTAHHAGESVVLRLPLLGRHSVHTALAATAAGLLLGLGWDAIVDGLRDESAQLRLFAVPGIGGSVLIDDTYNASPASSIAALNLLAELEGRRIVVLGDMYELGHLEEEAHRKVGARAAEVASVLVTVGPRAAWIADEARRSGLTSSQIIETPDNLTATEFLRGLLQQGDYVLVKGSRGMAMETIVAALQRQAANTLV